MSRRRGLRRAWLGLAVVAAIACIAVPASAAPPLYDGSQSFPSIQGPEGPEEFAWEVDLDENQELVQISDQLVQVVYTDSDPAIAAFDIAAGAAHDVDGAAVPTSITASAENIVTLTVHHRVGNPAAGGAPFDYPISAGPGWEGGGGPYVIQAPTPEGPPPPLASPAHCVVPKLTGKSVKAARRALRAAGCSLGVVWGKRSKAARVVRQKPKPGTSFAPGTEVGVKVAG